MTTNHKTVDLQTYLHNVLAERMTMLDSYSRLGALVGSIDDPMFRTVQGRAAWLRALGECWTRCDNVSRFQDQLSETLPLDGPVREMMTDEENAAYDGLADTVTVYRGCGPHNVDGLSWSLDPAVARAFPTSNRYLQREPLLVTGQVSRDDILAVKLDRDEAEVISQRVEVIGITAIDA